MLKNKLLATVLLASASSLAIAADTPNQAQAPANGSLREEMTKNLQQAGFSDVKVMPDSFLVSAKDKTGNPVTMFINPDLMTEITAMAMPAQGDAAAGGAFATVPAAEDLSSKVVGLDIYNKANQDIGTIKDIAFDPRGLKAYVVGVGGFLGMGDHYVAVRPSAVQLSYNVGENKWHATMDTNADQLKKAPEFKYSTAS